MAASGRNYERDMPKTAPDFLREWAEAYPWKRNALIFKAERVTDCITGIRERAALCVCTACGSRFHTEWRSNTCHGGWGGRGIYLMEQGEIADHMSCFCPDCGAEVTATHIQGQGAEYAREDLNTMTIHRIPEPGKADRAALVIWDVRKYFTRGGERYISVRPREAAVFEESAMLRVTKYGRCCYWSYEHEWQQLKDGQDTIRAVYLTVCPEGIGKAVEGTVLENAKLELYMKDEALCFPVAYLKLWQKRKSVETLLTCGAAPILRNLIGQEKAKIGGYSYNPSYNTKAARLPLLDWKKRRPADILRMDGRGELREMLAAQRKTGFGGRTWELFLEARKEGIRWSVEDIAAAEALGMKELRPETADKPAKIRRYLDNQKRRRGGDNLNLRYLLDYWVMRAEAPEELRGEEWPENLIMEHDLAVFRRKEVGNRALQEKFREREKVLKKYCFEENGILIRPPHDEGELIKEGKILNHCVATYAKRHASGETAILLIRRTSEPDMPWFTLNLDERDGTVIQNRGQRNCDRTPEIEAFEKDWLEFIHKKTKVRVTA